MKFKEKASAIVLAVVLTAGSLVPVNAFMKQEIVGNNRYETAAKIADQMGDYSTAILVNGNSIADGLSASGLAGKENAPILLVKKDSIPKETMDRLMGVEKIYIIGKEGAISSNVENELHMYGMYTERIGGNNRIETSLEVSEKIGDYSKAFLVNGMKGEADAMSVASVAARDNAPIILTNGKDNPTYKMDGVKYYVVGGNAVMSDSLKNSFEAERLSGSNRYITNKVIVEKFYPDTNRLYFAKGDGLVDALTVSPLAKNSGLALVSENSDKSVFYQKEDLVQIGGMSSSIVDKVFNATMSETPNPDENQKPEPPIEDQKPSEQTYDINSAEFQKIVRDEFYRLLDAHRTNKFGYPKVEHHWAFEESAMAKSKHMIDNNYYSHDPWITGPHVSDSAECIHWIYVRGEVTESKGIEVANELFNDWKNSSGHNDILLGDATDILNCRYNLDGFAFAAKWNGRYDRYDLKATYHAGETGQLVGVNEPSVELTSIPEGSVRNIVEVFK